MTRVAIIVDGQNTYASAKGLGIEIDYKLVPAAMECPGTRLVRATYYTVVMVAHDDYRPLQGLLDFIEYNGWSVVTKDVHELGDGRRERGTILVDLAVGALEIAEHVDEIALFTGDAEFVPLVETLQRRGLRVTLVSTIKTASPCSDDLRRQADRFVDLIDLKAKISREAKKDQVAA